MFCGLFCHYFFFTLVLVLGPSKYFFFTSSHKISVWQKNLFQLLFPQSILCIKMGLSKMIEKMPSNCTTSNTAEFKRSNYISLGQIFSHKVWVWSKLWYEFDIRLSWGWGHFKYGIFVSFGMSLVWVCHGWHPIQTKNMEDKDIIS